MKTMRTLILASQSPTRREMLQATKLPFKLEVSGYEEDMGLDLPPKKLAIHLATGKARAVAGRHGDAIIIGVDSFAVYRGKLFGKPLTNQRAREMLTALSGDMHVFISGFTIVDIVTGREYSEAVESKVYFRRLSEAEIVGYLNKENVLQQAAAYKSQGLGAAFIEKIEGDPSNVRGLPLGRLTVALREFGINLV